MEVCIVLEGEDASEVLDLAYDMYARCRESCTDRSGVDGDTAFALMPPSIERGQSRTAARMCLFQSIPSNKMVREATADIRRRARRHAGGRGGVVLRVIPRTSTRRYYTGLDNGVLHVCLPWAAGSGVETPTVEHARAALLEAGWEHVRVGPWRSNHPRWGTVGGQMSHEHHVPSFAFGPGQSAGVAPASVTVRDLCEAVFGDVVITRQLIDFVRAGERVVSPSSA
jgi:hypothetical protein